MSFQQGLSGLNSSAKALDVISNNVANASTVGFKGSSAHFADVFANSLAGSGASNIGIGSTLAAVQQQFSQGNLTATNNPLDIAINGGGFFRMSQGGTISFSRNGQFHLDKEGYVINDNGARLTGYPVDGTGAIVPASPGDIQIDASAIPPVATGASTGSTFKGVSAVLNLDSRVAAPATAWTAPVGTQAPSTDTYNYSTALSIFDTLGNPHNMTMYFVKDSVTPGLWNVHYQIDGTGEANVTSGTTALNFDTSGNLTTAMPILAFSVDLDGVATDLTTTNSAAPTLTFDLDFTDSSQYGAGFSASTGQDGYTSGRLTGLNVGADGIVLGRYSNGQSRNLSQVVLANFKNPNGLASLGGNQWSETADSGSPQVGAPNTGTLGVLTSSSVEESNVDMTAELVAMITQQRAYQANAQSIKTQDSILQTLVNLR